MEPIKIQDKYIKTKNNTNIFVRSWVKSGSEKISDVLLILHGMGAHSDYYDYFAPLLAYNNVLVRCYDRHGFGLSGGKRGDNTNLERDLSDLDEVVEDIYKNYPEAEIHLVAESWGCAYALRYLSQPREFVKDLVLISVPINLAIKLKTWTVPFLRFILDLLMNIFSFGKRKIGPFFPLKLSSRDPKFFEKLKTDKHTVSALSLHSSLMIASLFLGMKKYAKKIKVPVLTIQAKTDLILKSNGAQSFFELIKEPNKKIIYVNDAYHTLYYDPATPEVAQDIIRWIKN